MHHIPLYADTGIGDRKFLAREKKKVHETRRPPPPPPSEVFRAGADSGMDSAIREKHAKKCVCPQKTNKQTNKQNKKINRSRIVYKKMHIREVVGKNYSPRGNFIKV